MLRHHFTKLAVATGLTLALSAGSAAAATITFNFEELPLTSGQSSIASTQNSVTLTVHRADNLAELLLTDLNSAVPFGDRSLLAGSTFNAGAQLVFNFSQAVSNISISFGDFNQDDDSMVTLVGFAGLNGTGANLGSASIAYPASLNIGSDPNAFRTLTLNVSGLQSFTILGGGDFPNSLYYDNIIANTDAVPEPASMLLLGSGAAALIARRRRSARQ